MVNCELTAHCTSRSIICKLCTKVFSHPVHLIHLTHLVKAALPSARSSRSCVKHSIKAIASRSSARLLSTFFHFYFFLSQRLRNHGDLYIKCTLNLKLHLLSYDKLECCSLDHDCPVGCVSFTVVDLISEFSISLCLCKY